MAKKTVNLLDKLSPNDLEKIESHKSGGEYPLDAEWILLAEFARAFGWQAYLDARDDKIDADEMITLLQANRKLESASHYRNAEAAFIGAVSAQVKRPTQMFKKMTKDILKNAKVIK